MHIYIYIYIYRERERERARDREGEYDPQFVPQGPGPRGIRRFKGLYLIQGEEELTSGDIVINYA